MGIWRGLVVAGLAAVAGFGLRAEAQRLPGGVRPDHYSLVITPDLKDATFTGSETIEVVLDAPSKSITLNAAEIEFVSVQAFVVPDDGVGVATATTTANAKTNAGILRYAQNDKGAGGNDKSSKGIGWSGGEGQSATGQSATVALDEAQEQATFSFARELPAGRVRLAIEYRGILNDKLRGFYLSKTKTRNYGVTQFEATDARRAFPSFDEPALKATFDVSLVVDAGDEVISNMTVVSDRPGPVAGKRTIAFATTPRMSTYLVAWLVGDFKCSKGKADGVAIRACATPDKVKLTRFALDAAKQTLKDYDQYFGIKYPLAKLDLVAIPDFEAGAMENFGCITFRETMLLVDKKNGVLGAKKEVAETVAHEMAHQWFGDLVTPAWWDNLWLNEGFATWMESKEAAREHPTWRFEQDAATAQDRTMNADAGRTTRTIRAQAESPSQIGEMFDGIAYGKAGAVIGMVENYVGEEAFRRGVHEYLAEHSYGNATAEDFWGTMARVSGLPVDAVMRSFVEQPGVPLVHFGGAAGGEIPATQERFFLTAAGKRAVGKDATKSGGWTIPVCFKGAECRLLTPGATALPTSAGAAFFFANAGDKGYYRTEYSAEQIKAIIDRAETGLTVPERIGLLGDRWALMRAGQGTVGEFLDLALAVKADPNAAVLDNVMGKIDAIETRIAMGDDLARLNAVIRLEFGGVYEGLSKGGKHSTEDREDERATLFEALGRAGDPVVLAQAKSVSQMLFAGQKPTDGVGETVSDASVALVVTDGDVAMYESMLRVAETATDPDLKEDALQTLTRFQRPELVTRTLELAVSDAVRSQDSWMLIALLLERRETQDQTWGFVQKHWAEIARRATLNSGARIVEATGAFCTVPRRDEVASFFAAHPVASAERTLAKAVDNINDCIQLRTEQEPELRHWLDVHAGK
ncbi:MAG: M1 family aminopeptidase [Acidobacteriaceae bacterium]|nr:M1 family aminopeptidase [Acidobacteriaceae bacterium]